MQSRNANRSRNRKSPHAAAQPESKLSPAAFVLDIDSSPAPSPPLIDIAIESEPEPEIVRDGLGGADYEAAERESREPEIVTIISPIESPRAELLELSASESRDRHAYGHTRAPVLARESSMLEAFSRTVRNYVPSSIPIPTASPSPPRISRPVSFGRFATGTGGGDSTSTKRRGSSGPAARVGFNPQTVLDDLVVESEDEEVRVGGTAGTTRYPGVGDGEDILWAGWDSLQLGASNSRRVLFLGYPSGVQIWDCAALDSVSEILNLSGPDWSPISFAGALPLPSLARDDQFRSVRPMVAFVVRSYQDTDLLVYSLASHQVVKRLPFPGLVSFQANSNFMLISTTDPPMIHILSSHSLTILYSIPSASLLSFAHPSHPLNNNNSNNNTININHISVSPSYLDSDEPVHEAPLPQPIFALSGRFLAFASSPPRPGSPTDNALTQPRARSPSGRPAGFSLGVSQADFGNAALKVGGSVLSGVKALGGMAYAAARSRAPAAVDAGPAEAGATGLKSSFATMFFSKSAPAASGHGHERRSSHSGALPTHSRRSSFGRKEDTAVESISEAYATSAPFSVRNVAQGYYVTILDLQPLLSTTSRSSLPEKISQFLVSHDQIPSRLIFSGDGMSLAVCPKDGQVVKIFQIRPTPRAMKPRTAEEPDAKDNILSRQSSKPARRPRSSIDDDIANMHSTAEAPWHVYNLRRGRTSAIIEESDWAVDGRWFAIGTRNRTIHIFAVNHYGGKPDEASHLEGRVRNVTELQPLSTEVSPLIRLRPVKPLASDRPPVPLVFTFIHQSSNSLPSNLLPPPFARFSGPSVSSSARSSPVRQWQQLSPTYHAQLPSDFQDILVFDPTDGTLFLRRFTIERRVREQSLTMPQSVPVLGGTSISLPGVSAVGRLGTSPPSSRETPGGKASGLSKMMEKPTELTGRASVVSSWNLRRTKEWKEVTETLSAQGHELPLKTQSRADWISQAELSTSSRSPHVLPGPIYKSHQFSFYALGEDYHALIRRYQFMVPVTKIEVRKEVEVSAYSAGIGESFVQGGTSARDVRQSVSSFDEPLASAISAGLDMTSSSPPTLPMLPNGTPGSRPFRTAIPIRTVAAGLSEGVNEGIDRLRREIGKVRSPRLNPVSENENTGPIGLAFDEDDEHFLSLDALPDDHDDESISRGTSHGEASISTPSTNTDPLAEGEENWDGWGQEENQVVEDAETFDEISAVGFMDEEQLPMFSTSKKRKHGGGGQGGI